MTTSTEKNYFYEINQQTLGPVSHTELIELVKNGKVTYGNSIWTEGFPDWIKVENSEFKSYISSPPPVTPRKMPPLQRKAANNAVNSVTGDFNPHLISNVWVWLLAISPFVVLLIVSAVVFAQCQGNEYCMGIRVATGSPMLLGVLSVVVLNIVFSLLDESKLKKAGVNTKEMSNIGAWLVPAYLWQRSQYLQQSPAYFIVWIISIVAMILVLSGAI